MYVPVYSTYYHRFVTMSSQYLLNPAYKSYWYFVLGKERSKKCRQCYAHALCAYYESFSSSRKFTVEIGATCILY